jgi:predicted GNAT family acetyltransferase
MADITVADVPSDSRYEIRVDGELAGYAAYRGEPHRIVFTHTEIDPAYEGQGLGGRLAAAALDDVRARGLAVRADCPFIAGFIRRHAEYQDLVRS